MKILISVQDHHGRELLEAVLRMKEFEKHIVVIDDTPSKQELAEIIKESEAIKYLAPPQKLFVKIRQSNMLDDLR